VCGGAICEYVVKVDERQKVKPYETAPLVLITLTGTDSGVAQLPFAVTSMNLFVNLKQKDLGISNMHKTYGALPDRLD